MKIQRFLDSMNHLLLYGVDVSLTTIKEIILEFSLCLSNKELERWNHKIQLLLQYNNTQESIAKTIKRITVKGDTPK